LKKELELKFILNSRVKSNYFLEKIDRDFRLGIKFIFISKIEAIQGVVDERGL
jgi:hypothetical protein